MKTRPQTTWLMDAVLFVGFIAAFFPDMTGVELHQWIGILGGTVAVYHLAAHQAWVSAVVRRFFGRTSTASRLYLLIDFGIMLGFLGMLGTGVILSTWMSLNLSNYAAWHALHIVSSIVTLLIVVIKIGLRWRWIAAVGRKVLEAEPRPAVPASHGAVSRREFLSVMGLTGFAAAVALTSGATGLLSSLPGEAAAALDEASDASSATSAASSTSSGTVSSPSSSSVVAQAAAPLPQASVQTESETSASCSVACRHGCSFPGECRKYVDTSGNGLCDNGECM